MSDLDEDTNKNPAAESAKQSRGWRIVDFSSFNEPPEFLAALLYVLGGGFVLATLVMIGIGVIASFRFARESLIGDFKDRVEVAKIFFPVLVALIGGPLLVWRVVTAHWTAQG